MGAQEEFRNKHSRSGSRGLNSPASIKQDVSEHRHRANCEAANFDGSASVHGRAASTQHAGDLKQMKHERQRKREQAARELEERRKSLAKHAQIPSIPHPNEFSPAITVTVETAEPKPLPDDIPPRSATEPPQRSMYARNGPVIGLPATPKAIRLSSRVTMIYQEAPLDPTFPPFQSASLKDTLLKPHLNSRLRESSPSPSLASLCCHRPFTSHRHDLLFLAACLPPFQIRPASPLHILHAKKALGALRKLFPVSDGAHTRILCPLPLLRHLQFLRNLGTWLRHLRRFLPLFNTPSNINRRVLLHRV